MYSMKDNRKELLSMLNLNTTYVSDDIIDKEYFDSILVRIE